MHECWIKHLSVLSLKTSFSPVRGGNGMKDRSGGAFRSREVQTSASAGLTQSSSGIIKACL